MNFEIDARTAADIAIAALVADDGPTECVERLWNLFDAIGVESRIHLFSTRYKHTPMQLTVMLPDESISERPDARLSMDDFPEYVDRINAARLLASLATHSRKLFKTDFATLHDLHQFFMEEFAITDSYHELQAEVMAAFSVAGIEG